MSLKLKLKITLFFLLVALILPNLSLAQNNKIAILPAPTVENTNNPPVTAVETQGVKSVNIYFFYAKTCPHCKREALYLAQLKQEYQDKINIYAFEITENYGNIKLFQQFGQAFNVNVATLPTPSTFIGTQNIDGYYNDEFTGTEIKNLVDQCLATECVDVGWSVLHPEDKTIKPSDKNKTDNQGLYKKIKVPLIGEVNLQNSSLFLATIVLGGLDGFNPCAMWVLIFLISLLLNIKSARRRWLLGSTFIVASGLVYYLFMAAWLNTFLFIGYLLVVRIIIGVLAVAFGVYNLKRYFKEKSGVCEITQTESRQRLLERMKNAALHPKIIPALIGIIVLAFAVNLIELACSAGFPAIYTKMLASHNLSHLGYYLYLLLYIFLFMLDDIVVFIIAMVTLKVTGVDAKYSKYSNLVGGLLILVLGLLLVFKPNWLMFG